MEAAGWGSFGLLQTFAKGPVLPEQHKGTNGNVAQELTVILP
jgi:hypothetical protein